MSEAPPLELDILLPYWGDPALLAETVESVLAQDDTRWRLTIVDDGYPDPAAQERWGSHGDPRISYLRNEVNLGVAGNFERCRQLARGPLVVFLGSDDTMHPGFVRTVLAAHERHPEAAMIQVAVRVVGDDGTEQFSLADEIKDRLRPRATAPLLMEGEKLAMSLMRGNWLYWPSLVFRHDAIAGHAFAQEYPIILDLALVMDVVRDHGSLLLLPDLCFSYRRHDASASSASQLGGTRFADERRYFREEATALRALGWRRAAALARVRAISRIHALTLLPEAVRTRSSDGVRLVLRHALTP